MLQAIPNVHDRQFIATELASPATLVAELAQPEVKNILLAYVLHLLTHEGPFQVHMSIVLTATYLVPPAQ